MKNTTEREKVLAKEKEVLNKAQEEVKSADKYVKKIEDKKLKDRS